MSKRPRTEASQAGRDVLDSNASIRGKRWLGAPPTFPKPLEFESTQFEEMIQFLGNFQGYYGQNPLKPETFREIKQADSEGVAHFFRRKAKNELEKRGEPLTGPITGRVFFEIEEDSNLASIIFERFVEKLDKIPDSAKRFISSKAKGVTVTVTPTVTVIPSYGTSNKGDHTPIVRESIEAFEKKMLLQEQKVYNECIVGYQLNRLRLSGSPKKMTPQTCCFQLVYDWCKIKGDMENSRTTTFNSTGMRTPHSQMVIKEKAPISLLYWIAKATPTAKNARDEELLNRDTAPAEMFGFGSRNLVGIILQVLHALEIGWEQYGFCHNNLSLKNVGVRTLPANGTTSFNPNIADRWSFQRASSKNDFLILHSSLHGGLVPLITNFGHSRIQTPFKGAEKVGYPFLSTPNEDTKTSKIIHVDSDKPYFRSGLYIQDDQPPCLAEPSRAADIRKFSVDLLTSILDGDDYPAFFKFFWSTCLNFGFTHPDTVANYPLSHEQIRQFTKEAGLQYDPAAPEWPPTPLDALDDKSKEFYEKKEDKSTKREELLRHRHKTFDTAEDGEIADYWRLPRYSTRIIKHAGLLNEVAMVASHMYEAYQKSREDQKKMTRLLVQIIFSMTCLQDWSIYHDATGLKKRPQVMMDYQYLLIWQIKRAVYNLEKKIYDKDKSNIPVDPEKRRKRYDRAVLLMCFLLADMFVYQKKDFDLLTLLDELQKHAAEKIFVEKVLEPKTYEIMLHQFGTFQNLSDESRRNPIRSFLRDWGNKSRAVYRHERILTQVSEDKDYLVALQKEENIYIRNGAKLLLRTNPTTVLDRVKCFVENYPNEWGSDAAGMHPSGIHFTDRENGETSMGTYLPLAADVRNEFFVVSRCINCNVSEPKWGCKCKGAFYCGDECQAEHWDQHKKICKAIKERKNDEG